MSSLEVLWTEKYALFKLGVSPIDWGQMTKWQRTDLLFRLGQDRKRTAAEIRKAPRKKRLGAIFNAVVSRLLGFG